jgi:hypothetical protein
MKIMNDLLVEINKLHQKDRDFFIRFLLSLTNKFNDPVEILNSLEKASRSGYTHAAKLMDSSRLFIEQKQEMQNPTSDSSEDDNDDEPIDHLDEENNEKGDDEIVSLNEKEEKKKEK